MESFKRSLEELFSDFTPPAPEGIPPAPPEEKPPTPAPAPRQPAEDVLSGRKIIGQIGPEIPLLGAQVRNIRAQLLGNVLIVLAFILWIAILIGSMMARLNQVMVRELEETRRLSAALRTEAAISELAAAISRGVVDQNLATFSPSVQAAREQLIEAKDALLASAATIPQEDPLWIELNHLASTLTTADYAWTTSLIEEAQLGRWERVRFYYTYAVPYYLSEVRDIISRIERLTAERYDAIVAEANAARWMMRDVALAWGAVLVLVLVGLNIGTLRSVAAPLERLVESSARLAVGRLDERVQIDRADEFGRLARAFNEMADRLQTLYNELEERVQERTRALQEANYALQRRAIQLEASAEVSRSIISIFNVDELLRRAVNLIRDRFGFYHAGIFLIDETGEWAVLREATGEAGAQMKAQGHRLRVAETSMVGWTALHRKPRIALDVGKDAVRFANPLLPYTRSEMTLPLMVGGRLLGVLNVQSTEEAAFDEDDIRALQSMADQLAIAIENARRLSEEATLLEATSPVYRFSHRLGTATTVEDVANVIINAVSETEADGCLVVEFESSDSVPEVLAYRGVWRRDREPVFQQGMRIPVAEAPLSLPLMSRMWVSEDAQRDSRMPDRARDLFRATGVGALVNVPLRVGDRAVGQVVILRATPGPFSPASLRLYEVIGDQAAVALERARLLESMRQRAEQEEILRSIADQITATFDLRTALQTTLQQLGRVLDARGGYAELGTK